MHTNEKYELLLSAISHEIRNPVTLINSYLQLISSAHPEVGTFEYWNTVGEEMQHLKTLLGDLSLFNNSMKIHPISLDLNKWMHAYGIHGEAFLHCLTGDHPDKMTFTTLIASDLPSMDLDPDKLHQVLDNLLRNAAEAHASHITLEATTDGSLLYLTVSDNGCGIPEKEIPNLFDGTLKRSVSADCDGKRSMGLGLSVCLAIVRAHNGTMDAKNLEHGAEFTFRLPLSKEVV